MIGTVLYCKECGTEIGTHGRSDRAYCSEKCGNRFRNRKFQKESHDKYLAGRNKSNDKRRATPEGKYLDHKHRAKQSGVEFNISFEAWWALWEPHWDDRGIGKLVMCRKDDKGPYEVGNVRIDSQANNNREAVNSGGRSRKSI